ncbi:hypothetical protein [Listeria grandensis]|uniref:hypothetical protein n=1 Tax=Listeria grandensis TaxID=1494963 RepID=UPI0004B11142|nr:hypothetical protein [Listeria grandensis]
MLATAEKVNLVGFDGPDPKYVIFWIRDGKQVAKTVCYDDEDYRNAMAQAWKHEGFEVIKNAGS